MFPVLLNCPLRACVRVRCRPRYFLIAVLVAFGLLFAGLAWRLAPEVLARQKRNTCLADVWSLGVMLFVICTGYFPWPADNDVEFEKAVRRAKLDFPSFVDPKFAAVVQSLVCVTPWKRMKLKEALAIVTKLGKPTISS